MTRTIQRLRSIKSFSILAIVFAIAFVWIAWNVEYRQSKVIEAAQSMQDEIMPEVLRLQRTGRNLEQVRSIGDQLITVDARSDKQDLLLMLRMITMHPSIQRNPKIGKLGDEISLFLVEASIEIERNPESIDKWRKNWEPIAQNLRLSADEVMTSAAYLMTQETNKLSKASDAAGNQMLLTMTLTGALILLFVFLLQIKILRPLIKIHQALLNINNNSKTLELPKSNVLEIKAIEDGIVALDDMKKKNDAIQKELAYQANHDVLTSLPNRRLFTHSAERTLSRTNFEGKGAVVGIVDIDFFKQVNDQYSHIAGDQVLQQFAQLLEHSFRPSDLICRYGGEEFAFILLDTDLISGQKLAERLRSNVAKHRFTLPEIQDTIQLTISIGLAQIGPQGLEKSISQADQALYQAKNKGRNCTVVHQPLTETV